MCKVHFLRCRHEDRALHGRANAGRGIRTNSGTCAASLEKRSEGAPRVLTDFLGQIRYVRIRIREPRSVRADVRHGFSHTLLLSARLCTRTDHALRQLRQSAADMHAGDTCTAPSFPSAERPCAIAIGSAEGARRAGGGTAMLRSYFPHNSWGAAGARGAAHLTQGED